MPGRGGQRRLEWRQRTRREVQAWLETTPVQCRLRAQAGEADVQRWAESLVASLCKTGQVQADDRVVRLSR